jgi:pimeloyl-ACP methyl ester carboxylesterase
MSNYLKANILAVEYVGYGMDSHASKAGPAIIKSDAVDVYKFLNYTLGFQHKNIVVIGRSIGSGPACYLAEKLPTVKSIERFAQDLQKYGHIWNYFDNKLSV